LVQIGIAQLSPTNFAPVNLSVTKTIYILSTVWYGRKVIPL